MPLPALSGRRRAGARLAVLAGSAALAGVAAAVLLAFENVRLRRLVGVGSQEALEDRRVREAVVDELVRRTAGAFDTHNDPDVGRVLQAGMDGKRYGSVRIVTNRLGLREREIELPKPEGRVRVVLLGDSFVFGTDAEADERAGVFLEEALRERAGRPPASLEVLHVGVVSWNVLSECAYVRRQLSLLQPDLVIHVTTGNDLDDLEGVRGFGALASFAPRHRGRADAALLTEYPAKHLGLAGTSNRLIWGHDFESRRRYELAADAIGRLERALRRQGGRYLHVLRWRAHNPLARRLLGRDLADEQVLYLSREFANDRSTWVAEEDAHWNALGMERLAKALYGAIRERGLLAGLELSAWPAAEAELAAIHGRALEEIEEGLESWLGRPPFGLGSRLELSSIGPEQGAHVYGGLDAEGRAGPFASVCLARAGSRLRVAGQALGRPEIEGARLRVSADGEPAGEIPLVPGETFDEILALAPSGEPFVTVWLEASDYAYAGDDLQRCVAYRLDLLAVEP